MKLTGKQLNEWRAFVSAYAIEDSILLVELSEEQILSAANGIGPDRWPEAVRRVVDFLNPCFILPSIIHDLQFTYRNDGTKYKFHSYNGMFERNCKRMAKYEYAWWRPMRYIAMQRAGEFGIILDSFGWRAWMQAYEEAQTRLALG